MAGPDLKEIEIRRVTDLCRALGYSVVKTEYIGEKAQITLEKIFEAGTIDMLKGDAERLQNMLKQFDWSLVSSSIAEKKVGALFEKRVAGEI